MAEVTNELLLEPLVNIQTRLSNQDENIRGIREELVAIRMNQHATQGEVNSDHLSLNVVEKRIERIENRIDMISEPAE